MAIVSGVFILKKRRYLLLLSLLLPFVLASCSEVSIDSAIHTASIRPITKIGLIAPFEGIYRRAGYESLTAMRAALSDHAVLMQEAGIDILPLALDDSGDPQRAARTAQKLMSDPAVGAVIGPISLWTAHAAVDTLAAPTLQVSNLHWERPYLAGQSEEIWLQSLFLAVNQASLQQGAKRLLIIAGDAIDKKNGWPLPKDVQWGEIDGLPIHFVDTATDHTPDPITIIIDQVEATDAILFLGSPADAATFVSALRQTHEAVPFWMGPQGGDPILYERASRVDKVYWATWIDEGYEEWVTTHQPATPSAYLVYKATERAIRAIVDHDTEPENNAPEGNVVPQMRLFSVEPNGISIAYQP